MFSRVVFEGLGVQNDVLLATNMLQNTQITTINTHLLNKTMHYVHKQCNGNYMELKIFNCMHEIEFFRNSSQASKHFRCPEG